MLECCHKKNLQRRHTGILHTLIALVRKAGLSCKEEQSAANGSRPGDAFIPRWDSEGPLAIDVTCRHANPPGRGGNDHAIEDFYREHERDKVESHGATCNAHGWSFLPFVVSTWGGLGPKAKKFMHQKLPPEVGYRGATLPRRL